MMSMPNEKIAAFVASALTNETVLKVERLTTGNQNYVYGIQTNTEEYVIRLTSKENKKRFIAALYWQDKLLPLGVPLAKFISYDLKEIFSPYPSLLMKRLPGKDIGEIYSNLTSAQKSTLASQMADIHTLVEQLHDGQFYGYTDIYETPAIYKSWYDFLMRDLQQAEDRIYKLGLFKNDVAESGRSFSNILRANLDKVRAQIFLPDTTVKNVIINEGRLSGIVDVDFMCFGDPLYVISLTYAGSEVDGQDIDYAQYWMDLKKPDLASRQRVELYRLLHTIWFMGEHSLTASNNRVLDFNVDRLNAMYLASLDRLKKIIN